MVKYTYKELAVQAGVCVRTLQYMNAAGVFEGHKTRIAKRKIFFDGECVALAQQARNY